MKEFRAGRFVLLVAFFGCALGLSSPEEVRAAGADEHKRPSTELFDAGLEEMKAGHFESGCRLLEESFALEPLLGTLFTLGECEARRGRVETALLRFVEFEEKTSQLPEPERTAQARRLQAIAERRRELEPRRSYLDLRLRGPVDANLEILIDERKVEASSLARPLPLDAGMHSIVVRRGERENSAKVELREGTTVSHELVSPPAETPEPLEAKPDSSPPPGPSPVVHEPPPLEEPPPRESRSKSWTYVSLGLGVAGAGVAGVSTFVLLSKKPTLDENCPNRVCKNEEGLDAARDVGTWNVLGTIGAVGGALGFGVFTYLLLTEPNDATEPHAGIRVESNRGGGTLLLEGNF